MLVFGYFMGVMAMISFNIFGPQDASHYLVTSLSLFDPSTPLSALMDIPSTTTSSIALNNDQDTLKIPPAGKNKNNNLASSHPNSNSKVNVAVEVPQPSESSSFNNS
jgi:hypothetical protein